MTRASDLRAYADQLRAEASDPDLCDADVRHAALPAISDKRWTQVGYRLRGDDQWQRKSGAPMSPADAVTHHALGHIHSQTRHDGKLEILEIKGRR